MTGTHQRLVILFGSQTGKALSLAQDIFENCKTNFAWCNKGVTVHCYSFDLIGTKYVIEDETLVIMVVPTVGEGEPPFNTVPFWRHLCRKANPRNNFLENLKYSLFALGNSNYERFATFGKQLDEKIQELGGKQLYQTGFGDDSIGIEIGYTPWLVGLMEALHHELSLGKFNHIKEQQLLNGSSIKGLNICDELQTSNELDKNLQSTSHELPMTFKNNSLSITLKNSDDFNADIDNLTFPKYPLMDSHIYKVKLVDLRCLTGNNESVNKDEKIILEATFETSSNFIDWIPGDAFGFIIGNSDFEANLVLKLLKIEDKASYTVEISSSAHSHLPKRCTLFNLIKFYLEIRAVPKKSCLKILGDYCLNESHRESLHKLSSREGVEEYRKILRSKTTILDILVRYNSCAPPIDIFITTVPALTPRFYSLLNLKDDLNKFKVAFNIIFLKQINERQDTQLFGIFTGLMFKIWEKGTNNGTKNFCSVEASSIVPEFFRVFRKRNDHFKVPPKLEYPMIMVAVGTGVTPFLSFLAHKEKYLVQANGSNDVGESWLFYGCRHSLKDFIYSKELEKYKEKGALNELHVCFSRENPDSQILHVQDAIIDYKESLYKLIVDKNAYIYVCGDQGKFSIDVFHAFVEAVQSNLGPDKSAKLLMNQIREKGRYLQDIWA